MRRAGPKTSIGPEILRMHRYAAADPPSPDGLLGAECLPSRMRSASICTPPACALDTRSGTHMANHSPNTGRAIPPARRSARGGCSLTHRRVRRTNRPRCSRGTAHPSSCATSPISAMTRRRSDCGRVGLRTTPGSGSESARLFAASPVLWCVRVIFTVARGSISPIPAKAPRSYSPMDCRRPAAKAIVSLRRLTTYW